MGGPIGGRRDAVGTPEARGEGANAAQSHRKADLDDGPVGVAQQRGGPFEPAGQKVLMRGLAEGAPELAAEVRRREVRRPGERRNVERILVAGVDEVLGAKKVAGRRQGCDRARYRFS
jgi:hypothetical protein